MASKILLLLLVTATAGAAEIPYRLQLDTLSEGFDGKTCWVHPRAGAIPGTGGASPIVVLTMQKLLLTGSDVFYALNELRTDDLGKTWQGPTEHGKTLGRRPEGENREVAICDFTPKWHAASSRLLGTGHTVRYLNNKIPAERARETAYSVYDPNARAWSAWETLAMPDPIRFAHCGAGCTQRVDLPNGDILLPMYFTPPKEKFARVLVARCAFDGRKLRVLELGDELAVNTVRGLAEPSLARIGDRFLLTIRHDRAGYVATSTDGLHFTDPKIWCWDDGTELGNYNTQQHWVTHAGALFLIYTRTGAGNDHVFRHRAPLFIAQVDPDRLCVLRQTERILVPEHGARLGNFGVTEVSDHETWVTVAEWMQTWGPNASDYTVPMHYGSNNRVFAARILWDN
jgi:hypothetical protein